MVISWTFHWVSGLTPQINIDMKITKQLQMLQKRIDSVRKSVVDVRWLMKTTEHNTFNMVSNICGKKEIDDIHHWTVANVHCA